MKGREPLRFAELSLILKAEGKEMTLDKDVTARLIDENTIGIRLYHTDIITIDMCNIYKFNMLFPTSKTLDIFNRYTPAKVILKELKFYFLRNIGGRTKKQNLVLFFAGICVDESGNVYSENQQAYT